MTSRHFALLALLGASACSGPTSAEPCDGHVNVAVTTGLPRAIVWSPACGVSEVVVSLLPSQAGEEGHVVWAFRVSESSPVGPGLRYGIAPRRAEVWHRAEALLSGRTYRVSVAQTVGGDVLVASGEATFAVQ